MEQNNIKQQSDQESQETMHKQNNQNNSQENQQKVKQQNNNLQFQQTVCDNHKDQYLVFWNKTGILGQKLVCYQCCFEQQIQKENLVMLKEFFTMSEKDFQQNFVLFKQEETCEILEQLFDKNYAKLYSKIHIDALLDLKNKIIKYIDDSIQQINEIIQKDQGTDENLKQQYNHFNKIQYFQQILSQKYTKAQDLETEISKLLEDQSTNFQKFEPSLKEYRNNLLKQIDQQDQIILNFKKNIIDSKLTINYPKELINVAFQSQIISQEEQQMIKKWIGNEIIIFKKVYRATQDGFSIQNIYEQCKDKTKVILLIKTSSNKRFGFYSDLQIKDYGGQCIAQNSNNIFLFSLDLKQKYTSNESNYQHQFYSNNDYLGLGGGHDICLYNNSNNNEKSYVYQHNYGKKEGLSGHTLNGGTKNFKTNEIEICEVIKI